MLLRDPIVDLETLSGSDNDLGTVELKTLDGILVLQDFLDAACPQVPYLNQQREHEILSAKGPL